MCENDVRVSLAEEVNHHAALRLIRKNQFISDGRPKQARAQDGGGGFRLLLADASQFRRRDFQVAHVTTGKHGQGDGMSALGVTRQRAGAQQFNVVGMSPYCEDVHQSKNAVLVVNIAKTASFEQFAP